MDKVMSYMDCQLTATDIHTGCQENRPGTKRNSIKDLTGHSNVRCEHVAQLQQGSL